MTHETEQLFANNNRYVLGNRYVAAIGLFFFIVGIVGGGVRAVKKYQVPGPFDHENAGFCDFHNGLYYPTLAVIRGTSPYGQEYADDYPVGHQIPFFSPGFLALHAPIAMLPLRPAEILYFVLIIGFALSIGYVTAEFAGMPRRIDAILAISGALVVARGGHTTIFDGYFTFEIVLATLLAVHWAEKKPWLAACALVVVSAKPTYILPLGFLLLARGNFKALVIGAVLSIVAAAIPFAWISHHEGNGDLVAGFSKVLNDIGDSQEIHMQVPDESPIHTWTRLDLLAVVCKWLGVDPGHATHLGVMFAVLAFPMYLLFRRRQQGIDDGVAGMTGLLITTAFLVSLYHQSYDALVLIAPSAGVAAGKLPAWKHQPLAARWGLLFLIAIPVYNYLSTRLILGRLSPSPTMIKVMTSISGVSLVILLIIACALAWNQQRALADAND